MKSSDELSANEATNDQTMKIEMTFQVIFSL